MEKDGGMTHKVLTVLGLGAGLWAFSMAPGALVTGGASAAELILTYDFSNPRPYEYYPLARVMAVQQLKKEFRPVIPQKLLLVSDFNPGTPLLGESFANLSVFDPNSKYEIVVRVLDAEGKTLTDTLAQFDPARTGHEAEGAGFRYMVPRAGERLMLEAVVRKSESAGAQPDIIRWPIKAPYAHRLYLDRNRHWEGDAPLSASVKLNLGRDYLAKARLTLQLRQNGKVILASALKELPPDQRLVRCTLATRQLKPGEYTVVSEMAAGDLKSVSEQPLIISRAQRPDVIKVPLQVEEADGIRRVLAPVSGGIPFPDGTLRVEDASRVQMVDAAGTKLPAQSRVLATWGPTREWVRWLLVSSYATTAPRKTTACELHAGPGVKPSAVADPIKLTKAEDGSIVLDTGRVKFESHMGGGVFEQVWLDGKPLLRAPANCRLSYIPRFSAQAGLRTPKGAGFFTVDPPDPGLTAVAFPALLEFRPGTPPDKDAAAWLTSTGEWTKVDTRGIPWCRQRVGDISSGCYRASANISKTLEAIPDMWLRIKAGPGDLASVFVDGKKIPGDYLVSKTGDALRVPLNGVLTSGQHEFAVCIKAGTSGLDSSAGLLSPLSLRVPEDLPAAKRAELRSEAEDVSETLWDRTTSIEIVEAGPLRAEICLRGFFGSDEEQAERVVRIIAHRGSPQLELAVTWVNRRNPAEFLLGDLSLILPLQGGGGASVEMDGTPRMLKAGGHVRQNASDACVCEGGQGKRWGGWADAGGMLLVLDKHWQNFPTGFSLSQEGEAECHLWDGGGERVLDLGTVLAPEWWQRQELHLGVAKTYRLSMLLHDNKNLKDRAARAEELKHPLRLVADPKWVCASAVCGPLHPYDPERFPECEQALHNLFEGVELQQTAYHLYGAMDYGDFHSRWASKDKSDANMAYRRGWDRYRYWLNNETTGDSTTISLWLQYVRTMRRRYFDLVADRTRHMMDVDTIHYSRTMPARPHVEMDDGADLVGCQPTHDFYHWSGPRRLHHTSVDDILLYYHLTGDERALDVAKEMAGLMKDIRLGEFGAGSMRALEVPGRLAFHLYRQFGSPDLLQYARDSWETMRAYCGEGGRCVPTYAEYIQCMGDTRFLREFLMTDVVNEDASQPPLAALVTNYFGPAGLNSMVGDTVGYFVTQYPATVMPLAKGFYSHGSEYANSSVVYGLRSKGDPDCYGIGALPDAIPNNGREKQPVGYSWEQWNGFKYAYTLRALVESGMLRSKPAATITAARGTTGNWSSPATWDGGKVPGTNCDVLIPAECTVLYDGPAKAEQTCRSIIVEGRLAFAPGMHALVPAGDIVVRTNACLEMGPGAALLFDCNFSGEFGLKNMAGVIRGKGSSEAKRDCRVGALKDDGLHNTYIYLAGPASGIFEYCELFRLGAGNPRFERPDYNPKLGLVFEQVHMVNYIRLVGNDIHDCVVGLMLYKAHGAPTHAEDERIADNLIRRCEVGIFLRHGINFLRIGANRLQDNQTGILLQASCQAPGTVHITQNLFQRNAVGLHVRGAVDVPVHTNTYVDNEIALRLEKQGGPFHGQTYTDNRIAILLDGGQGVFQNETVNGGRIGVKLINQQGVPRATFVNCRLGVDKPNAEANVQVEATNAVVRFKDWTLGGPHPIAGHVETVQPIEEATSPTMQLDLGVK